jgi:hypothetical protein
MAYVDHFRLADDMIVHLNGVVTNVFDPFILSRYAGFTTVAAATVYELAIKEIIISFSQKKHAVFGTFTESLYERLNGRISLQDIKDTHIKRFGEKYQKRFKAKLSEAESIALTTKRLSITQSYSNIVYWRHSFAHAGQIPPNATYQDVVNSFDAGKDVIHCLAKSLTR